MTVPRLGPDARRALLQIARDAIAAGLAGGLPAPRPGDAPGVDATGGVFVTLRGPDRRLRGCIGSLEASGPLGVTVAEMARSAAFRDPRFPALAAEELPALRLEISALTPLRDLADPGQLVAGRHGLVVSRGGRRGVLLPQVATEFGWDRKTFLARTCEKAGLPDDAWRRGARLQVFEAEVFGEGE